MHRAGGYSFKELCSVLLLDELFFSTGRIFQSEDPVQVIRTQIMPFGDVKGNLSNS